MQVQADPFERFSKIAQRRWRVAEARTVFGAWLTFEPESRIKYRASYWWTRSLDECGLHVCAVDAIVREPPPPPEQSVLAINQLFRFLGQFEMSVNGALVYAAVLSKASTLTDEVLEKTVEQALGDFDRALPTLILAKQNPELSVRAAWETLREVGKHRSH